jgi:reactive intermediate/imine deaminase
VWFTVHCGSIERIAMSEGVNEVATAYAPAALGAYSQAVKANGLIFVSGQLGIDPATGELAGPSAGEQTAQALKNIKYILDAAGSGIEKVVRTTIYMKNVDDFHEVDSRYAQVFIGSVKPARVAFGGNDIPKGALVEIDAIAVA